MGGNLSMIGRERCIEGLSLLEINREKDETWQAFAKIM
jgi:hypothetical protein